MCAVSGGVSVNVIVPPIVIESVPPVAAMADGAPIVPPNVPFRAKVGADRVMSTSVKSLTVAVMLTLAAAGVSIVIAPTLAPATMFTRVELSVVSVPGVFPPTTAPVTGFITRVLFTSSPPRRINHSPKSISVTEANVIPLVVVKVTGTFIVCALTMLAVGIPNARAHVNANNFNFLFFMFRFLLVVPRLSLLILSSMKRKEYFTYMIIIDNG